MNFIYANISEKHLKHMIALAKETLLNKKIIVSREHEKRVVNGIEIYPYKQFLRELWAHKLI